MPPQSSFKQRACTAASVSIKKRIAASLGSRSIDDALPTGQRHESMNKIRKGHIRWLAKGEVVEQVRFINQTFGIVA